MFIEKKDVQVLGRYIPNIWELMHDQNATDILEIIDNLIIEDILEHDDEPSTVGRKLQLIYDRIEGSL